MIKSDDLNKEVSRIRYNPWARWEEVEKTEILIIDEISMCDGFLFNIVEEVLRAVRNNSKPFGGVQVILVGDCYQLPPVESNTKGFFFVRQKRIPTTLCQCLSIATDKHSHLPDGGRIRQTCPEARLRRLGRYPRFPRYTADSPGSSRR